VAAGEVKISVDGGATFSNALGHLKVSEDGGTSYSLVIVRQSPDGGVSWKLIWPPDLKEADILTVSQHPKNTDGQDTELLLSWPSITNSFYDRGVVTDGDGYPFDEWQFEQAVVVGGTPGGYSDSSPANASRSATGMTITGLSPDTTYRVRYAMHIDADGGVGIAAGSTLAPWKEASSDVSTRKSRVTETPGAFDVLQDDASEDQQGDFSLTSMPANATEIRLVWDTAAITTLSEFNAASILGDFTESQIVSGTTSTGDSSWSHNQTIHVAAQGRTEDSDDAPFTSDSFVNEIREPGAPTIDSVTGTGTSRTIQWDEGVPANADSYRIEFQNRACGDPWPASWSTAGNELDPAQFTQDFNMTFTHSPLTSGKQYRWRVVAINVAGETESLPTSAEGIETEPGAPTLDSATTETTDGFDLNWTLSGSGVTDNVEIEVRAVGVAFSDSATDTVAGSATSVTISGLNDDDEFHAQIREVNDCGDASSWSNELTGMWTKPLAPSSVDWLSVPAPKDDTGDTIEYTIGGQDVDDFEVYYVSGSGTPNENDTLAGDTEEAGLASDTNYSWRARGRNEADPSSPHPDSAWVWSTTEEARTHVDAPQITGFSQDASHCPTINMDLTVDHTGSNSTERAQGWEYRTNVNGGTWSSWTSVSHSSSPQTVTDIEPGGSGGDTINIEVRYQGDTPKDSASQSVFCTQ